MDLLLGFVLVVLLVVPIWKIFSKAGLNPLLSLLLFVPLAGVFIVTLLLAFMKWPAVERQTEDKES